MEIIADQSRDARRAHVAHALATTRTSDQVPSAMMERLLGEYKAGKLSSTQLTEVVKAHYCR
ncbi:MULTISPECIES: antitoxin VbhA family protein [Pseudomonas]